MQFDVLLAYLFESTNHLKYTLYLLEKRIDLFGFWLICMCPYVYFWHVAEVTEIKLQVFYVPIYM